MKRNVLVLLAFVGAVSCSTQPAENRSLSPAEFDQKARDTAGAVILDVRTPEELQVDYIKGAINMDFRSPQFKILIAGMDKTKPYFVYCASGVRSGKASDLMRDSGFEKVYVLEGGLKAWKAAGLSTAAAKATEP